MTMNNEHLERFEIKTSFFVLLIEFDVYLEYF